MKKVTFVLTSCGRNDLLEKTLDSFFKYNTYPIERYIITEDSADPKVFEECEKLNQEKYGGKLEFIFNYEKLGQSASIDKAYSMVETEYIFHCEEDWEFYRSGFIEDSIKVLETQSKVIQAWIRPKSDKILNKIENNIFTLPGNVKVRIVLPASFIVKGANEDGSDMVIKDYIGFSWNPGVKRLKDWQDLPSGYSGFEREHLVDQYYRDNGFMVVSLSTNDDEGYVRHSGWGRRAGDPVYRKENGISIIMASYLGKYPGSRSNSKEKFIRAVESFKNQTHQEKELIIVSDGCKDTDQIYFERYVKDPNITLVRVEKRKEVWPGELREAGRSIAKYDWIGYLDSDDVILQNHLNLISEKIKTLHDNEGLIFNIKFGLPLLKEGNDLYYAYLGMNQESLNSFRKDIPETEELGKLAWAKSIGHQGTWQIIHKKHLPVRWRNSEIMGEDALFIDRLKKISKWQEFVGEYVICHMTNNRNHIWEI